MATVSSISPPPSAWRVSATRIPRCSSALHTQAHRLIHAMGDVHPTALKVEVCRRLSALTFERWGLGPAKTVLGNSGSDAVEAALKTSLLHSGKPG